VRRLAGGLRALLEHRTIARRDRTPGSRHAAIFYGFITLFAGNRDPRLRHGLHRPGVRLELLHGTFYLAYKEVLNVLDGADRRRCW